MIIKIVLMQITVGLGLNPPPLAVPGCSLVDNSRPMLFLLPNDVMSL